MRHLLSVDSERRWSFVATHAISERIQFPSSVFDLSLSPTWYLQAHTRVSVNSTQIKVYPMNWKSDLFQASKINEMSTWSSLHARNPNNFYLVISDLADCDWRSYSRSNSSKLGSIDNGANSHVRNLPPQYSSYNFSGKFLQKTVKVKLLFTVHPSTADGNRRSGSDYFPDPPRNFRVEFLLLLRNRMLCHGHHPLHAGQTEKAKILERSLNFRCSKRLVCLLMRFFKISQCRVDIQEGIR